eukprot:TRINITY_DN26778_c0_g1_i1.p1 TRINITY_DN26778_c0_g1~~TRINITY_DN26778_c0_g1_i1.p1  ORF type:complete len:115 (-),score=23.02 TRINITY_DN26778_c0_g1_i1:55-399(-)
MLKQQKKNKLKLQKSPRSKYADLITLVSVKLERFSAVSTIQKTLVKFMKKRNLLQNTLQEKTSRQCKYDREGNCYRGKSCMFKHKNTVAMDMTSEIDTKNADDEAQENTNERKE